MALNNQEHEIKSKHNALASQMLRGVFSVYLFIAITVTGAHMVAEYFNAEQNIFREMEKIHKTFDSGLAQSLWIMDDEQSQTLPQGILNMPVITRVQLLGVQDNILVDVGEKLAPANTLSKAFTIYHFESGESNVVGTLILSSSQDIIIERLRYGFIFILVNALIKSIALWLIFLWFGKRLINIPLHTLTNAIKKMDVNNLQGANIPSPVKNINEISTLTDSFNTLINNLCEAKLKLDENHQKLEQEILEHKQAKTEIESLNSVLDKRVKSRTLELEESQKQAQHANVAKTQFLSRMSHELRTPLNEVLGFAQVQGRILRKDGNKRLTETTQHILDAGHKLLAIVEDILNYSQMENNTEDILLEICDIDIAIYEAIRHVNDSHKHEKVQINYSPCKLKAKSNLAILIQVVTHIVSNGVKYNHKKGSVNIMCTMAAEGHIEIAIQDTGVGIHKTHWDDIFSPFTRLEYAESQQIGGIGVGLSLARSLMRRMHGDVSLSHSSPDGSLFIISVPRFEDLIMNSPL